MLELPLQFRGSKEVGWDNFTQLLCSNKSYLYEREFEGVKSYEVFLRKESKEGNAVIAGISMYFEAKVRYPKSEDFGVWAWYYDNYDLALSKFNKLNV